MTNPHPVAKVTVEVMVHLEKEYGPGENILPDYYLAIRNATVKNVIVYEYQRPHLALIEQGDMDHDGLVSDAVYKTLVDEARK